MNVVKDVVQGTTHRTLFSYEDLRENFSLMFQNQNFKRKLDTLMKGWLVLIL